MTTLKAANNLLLIEPRLWLAALEEVREAQQSGMRMQAYRAQSPDVADMDVVPVSGLLMKAVPDEYRTWGLNATGYDEIAAAVTRAADSPRKAILLNINSGGGMVDGLDTAVNALKAAAAKKPVLAYVDGMAASAAYWIASQATGGIYATRLSEVGGIGVYTVVYDTQKAVEKMGARAVVSRSGDQKGMGILGDPITDTMKDAQDETVNDIARMFMADVTGARPGIISGEVNSGRTWIAERARDLNLIDGIVTSSREITIPAETIEGAKAMEPEPKTKTMAEDDPTPQHEGEQPMPESNQDAVLLERARVQAISTTFSADPDFARKHIEAGSTLEQAKAEHYDVVMARQAALKALDDTPEPVASAEPAEPEPFMERAKRTAFEQGKPLHEVVGQLARIDRAGYLAYIGAKKED